MLLRRALENQLKIFLSRPGRPAAGRPGREATPRAARGGRLPRGPPGAGGYPGAAWGGRLPRGALGASCSGLLGGGAVTAVRPRTKRAFDVECRRYATGQTSRFAGFSQTVSIRPRALAGFLRVGGPAFRHVRHGHERSRPDGGRFGVHRLPNRGAYLVADVLELSLPRGNNRQRTHACQSRRPLR